jgi:hypothetical protein
VSIDRQAHSKPDERSEGGIRLSRRTLLKAGWTAPVIMSVAPAVAFAASGAVGGIHASVGGNRQVPTAVGGATASKSPPTSVSPTGANGVPSAIPEQQSGEPEPARIDRGFAG